MTSFLGGSGSPAELAWSWFVLVGTVALFVMGWRTVWRLARRHADEDARARLKATTAVAFSLLLGFGGFFAIATFEAQSEAGIHTTFVKALNQTVGEGDYLENLKVAQSKPATVAMLEERVAAANATYTADPTDENRDARDAVQAALKQTREDLATAQKNVRLLAANHAVWLLIKPHLAAGTHEGDEIARGILESALDPARITTLVPLDVACARDAATGFCSQPLKAAAIVHSFRDLHTLADVPVAQGVPEAYEHQHEFLAQMQTTLSWFVYPGVAGLFLAPFAFAGGSILNSAFVPSDGVGYKPYPGKAAGFFLLLGAFGLFAVPFGAWTLRDLHKRSLEGQITL